MVRKLINPNQSDFMPGDSCIHQLISIIPEVYVSFDANSSLEVRSIFLDISKAKKLIQKTYLCYSKGKNELFRTDQNLNG